MNGAATIQNGNGASETAPSAAIPPPRPATARFAHAAFEQLRERCRPLGLFAWRCDNSGLVLREPEETGPIALLLQSAMFLSLVSNVVRRWNTEQAPEICELFEGCWALPIEERHRRARTGFTVLIGFGPESLHSERMAEACRTAQLDPAATRRSLLSRAKYSEQSCRTTREALLWMVQDLSALAEHEQTAAGFTRQLTDSYETIDLLYSLGRSMNDLTKPEKFIARLCERLSFTLGFGWVGVYVHEDHRSVAERPFVEQRMVVSGHLSLEQDRLEQSMARLLRAPAKDSQGAMTRAILTELDGRPIPGSGQLLMQPVLHAGRPAAAILAGDKAGDDPQVSSYDMQLLEAAAGFIGAFLDNAELYAVQEATFLGTLEALTASIDAKDRYTCGHSQRVSHLSHRLALAAGLSTEQADRVRVAGLVHDVGKIGVPETVLCKAGRLTDDEFAAIKKHPEIGHRILKDIPQLDDVLPGVLYHHERYDGRGYPHGRVGEDIPLMGRIIAIADTFDAMSSTRSYRSALPRASVLAELRKCAGTQLDPRLTPLFVKLDLSEYDRMVAQHAATGTDAPAMSAAA